MFNNASQIDARRRFFSCIAAAVAATTLPCEAFAADAVRTIGLGFSLYGMKSLSIADGLKACAEIGYDCVELPVMPDWPGDSAKLAAPGRRDLRAQLAECRLRLTSLMENLPALGDDKQHQANRERLRRACELAHDLAPARMEANARLPLIETILGGKAGEFDAVKERLVQRLRDWVQVLTEAKVTLAIKAHIGNATQRPEQLAWLLDQVASPWLQSAYDYSHFQLQGLSLAETQAALIPRTVFIHVKDTEHAVGKKGFLLPGEGSTDYLEYFRLLARSEYRGDVVVEVSSQVSNKPGYDPVAAARQCYNHLAPALDAAGLKRG